MPDTPEDRVAVYLAEAQQRASWVRKCERSRTPDAPYTLGVARRNSARDVRPLLAAVEAVLAEVDGWAALAPPDDWGESMHGTALADAGRSLREVISRELLGEGSTDV